MQNSVSEGAPFEGVTPESVTPSSSAAPPPVKSYDEIFPALSQSSGPQPGRRSYFNNNNNMRVGSSVVTQVFCISRQERKIDNSEKFGESECMRACTSIQTATNTKIEIAAGKDQGLTFLVSGKSSDVLDAKRRIIATFQTPSSTTVEIPKEYHRKLLGKGGMKMRELEKMTACRINVPNMNDDSNTITITGPRDGVEKALHEIKVTYDEQSKQAVERVIVPKMFHPFICGGHNENLNVLTAETNVKINVPPPAVKKDEIVIAGEKEGVQLAKKRILAIYEEMEKKCAHVSIEVPKSQHKYIIGPRGSTIAEILQQTGVSVEMPSTEETLDTITLRGPQEKLGPALSMVYAKANSVLTVTVNAPSWLHKRLRGKKGANIRALTLDTALHIEFKEDQNQIRVEGPPEEVNRVKEALEKEIAECLKNLVYEDIPVDPKFFKHIIGKGGANVNRLKDETGVEINISEEPGTSSLRIEGSREGVDKVKADLKEMIGKLENEKEKDVIIDQRFHPNIIGAKGERIREIREQFNQVQISFPQSGAGDVVKVRGPKVEVEKCAKYLTKLAKELQEENFLMEVPIYKKFHKNIIGKGGANIRKIREETGTKIDLPGEGDNSDVIRITGKEDRVRKAMDLIQSIQTEMANIVTQEITIPPKFHNSLIGAGGKLVIAISEECGGVQIKFPSQDMKSDKVIVRGPKEDVERAVRQLEELKNEREASSFTAEVKANPQLHKFLIGKSGNSIRKIREATGARIIFPSERDEDQETIVIMGKQDQVDQAKKELEQMIEEIGVPMEDEITVDPQYHKHFVARRGAIIQKITDECGGVTISFPRASVRPDKLDKVTLRGSKECVEMAKQRIEETVKELMTMVTIDCVIPQLHHRSIMGHKGSKVQQITADFNVQIKFPDRDAPRSGYLEEGSPDITAVNGEVESRPSDTIKITGQQENCEQAKAALLALIPVTVEVEVPSELHRSIIGKGGENVREMMERHDVKINVPPPEDRTNTIKVIGTEEATAAAKQALIQLVQDLEKERELKSYKVTVEVPPEYHSKIIGRGGKVINKIRDDFGVVIVLPNRESQEDQHIITIAGYEDKAIAAKEHILSIVGELESLVREEFEVDSRVHSRLIGQRRRAISKLEKEFNVRVIFPRLTDTDLNRIVVEGASETAVLDAKEEILVQAEEFLQDLADNYVPPSSGGHHQHHQNQQQPEGFIVRGAPWEAGPQQTPDTESITDFPSFGASAQGPPTASWGPRR